jgi:hypothetical protein
MSAPFASGLGISPRMEILGEPAFEVR